MAKQQRRPPYRPVKPPAESPVARSSRPGDSASRVRPAAHPPQSSSGQPRRSTYFEAVALYERGLDALQRHAYGEAANLLESVLRQYPEEKELHERVRLYLNICKRQAKHLEANPKTIDERLYAAKLAITGRFSLLP